MSVQLQNRLVHIAMLNMSCAPPKLIVLETRHSANRCQPVAIEWRETTSSTQLHENLMDLISAWVCVPCNVQQVV